MPVTEETPQAAKGFKGLMRYLAQKAPKRMLEVRNAGNRVRALTATGHHRRKGG